MLTVCRYDRCRSDEVLIGASDVKICGIDISADFDTGRQGTIPGEFPCPVCDVKERKRSFRLYYEDCGLLRVSRGR